MLHYTALRRILIVLPWSRIKYFTVMLGFGLGLGLDALALTTS